jgi:hypothetical protein
MIIGRSRRRTRVYRADPAPCMKTPITGPATHYNEEAQTVVRQAFDRLLKLASGLFQGPDEG